MSRDPFGVAVSYRRTDQDRRPPRQVVTGLLMGDPLPDRLERAEALRLAAKPPRDLPMPTSQSIDRAGRDKSGRAR